MKKKIEIISSLQICSRCIYDERVSSIRFDQNGVCNYCNQVDDLTNKYGTGKKSGKIEFEGLLKNIRKDGKGKKYDCVIGISGGTDSCYMVHKAVKDWNLRPLAVHYDNTWNSAIATRNIFRVLNKLNVDLYTHVVDNKEIDDIFLSFFRAGVSEIEASTDLGLAETLNRAAWKIGVRYVFEGHSFITEGITPLGKNYFDGKYIKGIHKIFGRKPIKTYPLMDFKRFLFWAVIARIKKIRPFWYLGHNKEDARLLLKKEYDWEYYNGHHLENRMSSFYHSIYLPQKFNTDMRNNTLSALVRNGNLDRKKAWRLYNKAPYIEEQIESYFQKRLGISPNEYASIMAEKPKSWHQYPNYKKRFEILRPFFSLLADANLVPRSFYLKYCFPEKE